MATYNLCPQTLSFSLSELADSVRVNFTLFWLALERRSILSRRDGSESERKRERERESERERERKREKERERKREKEREQEITNFLSLLIDYGCSCSDRDSLCAHKKALNRTILHVYMHVGLERLQQLID